MSSLRIIWQVEFTEFRGNKFVNDLQHPRLIEVEADLSRIAASIAVRQFKNAENPEVLYTERDFDVRRLYSLWIIPGYKFTFKQLDDPEFYGKLKVSVKRFV